MSSNRIIDGSSIFTGEDTGKDGLRKESLEVAALYKKHIMEFKVKMKNFERKYRD